MRINVQPGLISNSRYPSSPHSLTQVLWRSSGNQSPKPWHSRSTLVSPIGAISTTQNHLMTISTPSCCKVVLVTSYHQGPRGTSCRWIPVWCTKYPSGCTMSKFWMTSGSVAIWEQNQYNAPRLQVLLIRSRFHRTFPYLRSAVDTSSKPSFELNKLNWLVR